LTLESADCRGINSEDAKPLESVADICAAAIQNAYYFERVKQLAYRDGLTGVFNRRLFENKTLEEIERSERHGNPLSVLMVDIDGFKRLNDEFGHLLGDEVLKQVSNIFLKQTRKSDIVCRYGGDEFAILLPQTVVANALIVAEKLRRAIAEWDFPGVARPVTLSIGIAQFPLHGASRDELVKSADSALYAAKQAGRNRCVLCPNEVPASD
jgi:diguanylate cyclase (GGDEF)-like protein